MEEVILFLDGDEAGEKARHDLYEKVKGIRKDIKISYVATPTGEDANSLVQSHQPEILTHLIDKRKFFLSSEIEQLKSSVRNGVARTYGKLNTDNSELLRYETDLLHIAILGGIKITGLDRLRVTLKIDLKEHDHRHRLSVRHSLDLYHAKQVEQLVSKMAESLELGSSASARTISYLTTALEDYRQKRLELLKPRKAEKPEMSEAERKAGLAYLKDGKLAENTMADIGRSGIVGETQNAFIAYVCYTSRKREKPLHVMFLGSSGSGKTYAQE